MNIIHILPKINHGEGSEIDPETVCVQAVGARKGDCVPFV